jgi:hypothetical protein
LDSKETWKAKALENHEKGRTVDVISGLPREKYETIFGLDSGRYYEIIYFEGSLNPGELAEAAENICGEYSRRVTNTKIGQVSDRAIALFDLSENYAHITNTSKVPSNWRSHSFNCK